MTTTGNKWIEAISTLNELTQTGKLKWTTTKAFPPPSSPAMGLSRALYGNTPPDLTLSGSPFIVEYAGKTLRLARFSLPPRGLLAAGGDNLYVLDIIDNDGQELHRIPVSSGLNDLYRTVTRNASGVDDVLNSLLEEGKRLRKS